MTTTTSRRAILAGAAALPALAIIPATAVAGGVDPIFAAIDHHVAARAVYWSGERVSDEVMHDRGAEADLALVDLLSTRPTTVTGCIAVLRHVDHHLAKYEDGESQILGNCTDPLSSAGASFLRSIAAALETAAPAA